MLQYMIVHLSQQVGFNLDEDALEALRVRHERLLQCIIVTIFQLLHTEDRVFMATLACYTPNDEHHGFELTQQQVTCDLFLFMWRMAHKN
jgi:hypothetical protein